MVRAIHACQKRRSTEVETGDMRVLSSVGRAAPLQGVGREFEPLSTHQQSDRCQAVRSNRTFVHRNDSSLSSSRA